MSRAFANLIAMRRRIAQERAEAAFLAGVCREAAQDVQAAGAPSEARGGLCRAPTHPDQPCRRAHPARTASHAQNAGLEPTFLQETPTSPVKDRGPCAERGSSRPDQRRTRGYPTQDPEPCIKRMDRGDSKSKPHEEAALAPVPNLHGREMEGK